MKMIHLRDYQEKEKEKILRALAAGKKPLFVLPTGGGKTAIAAHVFRYYLRAGKRVLVLVHRAELVHQMHAALVEGMGVEWWDVGVIMGDDRRSYVNARIQVATVQTLRCREVADWPEADLIGIDEAHHAPKYQEILAHYPAAGVLGLTATPYRFDQEPLGSVFDTLIVGPRAIDLIEAKWLMQPRVYAPDRRGPNLSGVRQGSKDYVMSDAAARMKMGEIHGAIVPHWEKLAGERRTVAYACTVEHGLEIVASFREVRIPAELLSHETSLPERQAMIGPMGRLARGDTMVVVNCEVLTEGWDLPAAKCIIMARPTKSTGLCLQMSGRIFRPWREHPALRPVILDHAGNVYRHGLPHMDREYTLGAGPRVRSPEAPVRWCSNCQSIVPAGVKACPECGAIFLRRLNPEAMDGKLVEVAIAPEELERRRSKFRIIARDRKWDEAWADYAVAEGME